MSELQYIKVAKIHPHPGNPRKDLGDLTELADSIKANGILQNLTVVPLVMVDPDATVKLGNDHYTVVIGHRRLAAAAIAGLEKVPCVVADLNEREQARTMLMENMQHSDLTVYEQAQGFQMMLDLGDTVEEIAQQPGFSKATVRRRVKLLELDPKKFKKSVERGATIQDYAELEQIEDPALKNKVLDTIGTNNFCVTLQNALDTEKLINAIKKWEADISSFALKITKSGKVNKVDVPMEFYRNFNKWDLDREVEKPDDTDKVHYYYIVSDNGIDIYKDRTERVKTEEDLKREERERESARIRDELKSLSDMHFKLRRDFVSGYGAAKTHIKTIMQFLVSTILTRAGDWIDTNENILYDFLGIEVDDETMDDDLMKMAEEVAGERPEYSLLVCAYSMYGGEKLHYYHMTWNYEWRMYVPSHDKDSDLDRLYDFLVSLGYQMSDEEKAMQNGTHELFHALDQKEAKADGAE